MKPILRFPRQMLDGWVAQLRSVFRDDRSGQSATATNTVDDRSAPVHRIRCAEIWGGIQNASLDACTGGIRASLFSSSCEGGRGGDVYYFSVCGHDVLTRVALADVTGHGESVSRVSQSLYDSLAARMNSRRGYKVLSDLNREAEKLGEQAISTATVIGFYRWTGRLYFSYAGHPPVLLYRRRKRKWSPLELPETEGLANLPIGITDQSRFDQGRMRLYRGDRLLLYTDGVIEAPDPGGSLFGVDRLIEVLNQAADQTIAVVKDTVLTALREHTGGPLTHDDVTVLAVEIGR
jgi:sigma-B regulation protein RsbU (phosphoserine phosphatase)